MLSLQKITLDKKEIFDKFYKNMEASIYNFTNLYMWSGNDSIKYFEADGFIVPVFQFGKNPPTTLFPVGEGDFEAAINKTISFLKEKGVNPVFSQLTLKMTEKLQEHFPDRFEYIPNRNAADYVYEVEKMISHSGKKLHSKKNHLNYFKKTYNFEYKKLTESDMADCKKLFNTWHEEKDDALKLIGESKDATFKVLDNFDALGVKGGGIYVDGELIAFSVGEKITEEMALIHLEVASPEFRGAFNIMNQQFCENEWHNLKYVNREEDMGLEGLRKAKLAYCPVFLVDRWNAVLKD